MAPLGDDDVQDAPPRPYPEDTRRTRGKTSTVRVRSLQEPPTSIYRVTVGHEAYNLYITKVETPEKTPKQQKASEKEPSSWADAARRALGRGPTQQDDNVNKPKTNVETGGDLGQNRVMPPVIGQTAGVGLATDHMDQDLGEDDETDETSYEDDSYVEQRLEASGKRRKTFSKPRTGKSGRMRALESEMGAVKTQLDTILQQLSALARPTPPLPAPVPSIAGPVNLARASKGSIALNTCEAVDTCRVKPVPGDGACLWHACAFWKRGHNNSPSLTNLGGGLTIGAGLWGGSGVRPGGSSGSLPGVGDAMGRCKSTT